MVALFFGLYYERIMVAEEEFLAQQFGERFTDWARVTPAFIPSFRHWVPSSRKFDWRLVIRRDYGALFAAVGIFTLIEVGGDWVVERHLDIDPFWAALFFLTLAFYLSVLVLKTTNATAPLGPPDVAGYFVGTSLRPSARRVGMRAKDGDAHRTEPADIDAFDRFGLFHRDAKARRALEEAALRLVAHQRNTAAAAGQKLGRIAAARKAYPRADEKDEARLIEPSGDHFGAGAGRASRTACASRDEMCRLSSWGAATPKTEK